MVQLERTEHKLLHHHEHNLLDWDNYSDNRGNKNAARKALLVFWYMLKSGRTSVELMCAKWYHLVKACKLGALINARGWE